MSFTGHPGRWATRSWWFFNSINFGLIFEFLIHLFFEARHLTSNHLCWGSLRCIPNIPDISWKVRRACQWRIQSLYYIRLCVLETRRGGESPRGPFTSRIQIFVDTYYTKNGFRPFFGFQLVAITPRTVNDNVVNGII